MTNEEAIKEILSLSSGTVAMLIGGLPTYEQVDAWVGRTIRKVQDADVSKCKGWLDILETIGYKVA